MNQVKLDRIDQAGIEFAYLVDREGKIMTIPVNEQLPQIPRSITMYSIEICNDLMMVFDQDGNGHDCHVLTSMANAKDQLEKWQNEYSFNNGEAIQAVEKFFAAQ